MTTSGQAAGNFTHLIVHTGFPGSNLAGMRMPSILRFAGVSLLNADGSVSSGPTSRAAARTRSGSAETRRIGAVGFAPTAPTPSWLGTEPGARSASSMRSRSRPSGHLDPFFVELMEETAALLRATFRTENAATLPVSATGSGGMDALLANFVEPGDRVVVGVNGLFGERLTDALGRAGAEAVRVEADWGRALDLAGPGRRDRRRNGRRLRRARRDVHGRVPAARRPG